MSASAYGLAALFAAAVLLGVIVGAAGALLIFERTFRRVAAYQRSGVPDAPAVATGGNAVPHSAEASAMRAISVQAVDRGADELQATAKAQGITLTRSQAVHQARQMLTAADPIGGVR